MRELTKEERKVVSGGFRFCPAPNTAILTEPGRSVNPSRFTGKVRRKPPNVGGNSPRRDEYRSRNGFTQSFLD